MVLNSSECHFMCLGQNTVNEIFVYDNIEMKNIKEQKISGVIIDNKLRFKSHVKNLCKKASQKIWALSRLINYLNDSEKKMIFNGLMKSQFSYCLLLWMFCSRQTNNMINKINGKALRNVLNDNISGFESMLGNMNDITKKIHVKLGIYWHLLLFDMYFPASIHFIDLIFSFYQVFCCRCTLVF